MRLDGSDQVRSTGGSDIGAFASGSALRESAETCVVDVAPAG
jgi:hypothetical protein